ncbi:TVG0574635 [Thermoplasma volcanium GSS1]|uniref:TVG0574635 protein n=1 Tax=Thermoplasma volcanium (strain ATCC 51530 / DSM 4299 / JCM 9571 / NBRC 15438 / GSS1) TaxID=273116 RepID=Q97B71_THEVO|nr:TVG0574635 [Thermoplasma volcanium GSS1]
MSKVLPQSCIMKRKYRNDKWDKKLAFKYIIRSRENIEMMYLFINGENKIYNKMSQGYLT